MAPDDSFHILLPDREEKGVESMHPAEMQVVESFHFVANRHDLVVACARCRQPMQGFNTMQDPTYAIRCGCREIRATARYAPAKDPVSRN